MFSKLLFVQPHFSLFLSPSVYERYMLIYLLPHFAPFQPTKAAQAPMPYVLPWQMNSTLIIIKKPLFSPLAGIPIKIIAFLLSFINYFFPKWSFYYCNSIIIIYTSEYHINWQYIRMLLLKTFAGGFEPPVRYRTPP